MEIKVEVNNERLDNYLSKMSDFSRSKIQKLIAIGNVTVNGKLEKASYKVKMNDNIKIEDLKEEIIIEEENIPLDIVYEDEYLAIINKPTGLVVHPAVGNKNHTLVNGLIYHFNKLSNDNTIRPGIVHRLDKETSGLMVVAKDDKTHEILSKMIKNKEVERIYIALVHGIIKCDKGTIDAPIGRDINDRQKYTVTDINSKDAITHFNVIERLNNATLIKCKLETGRTHQIRVHLNYIGYPIVNDRVYGHKKMLDSNYGQLLHSYSIRFVHPYTKKELYYVKEPESRFLEIVDSFRN